MKDCLLLTILYLIAPLFDCQKNKIRQAKSINPMYCRFGILHKSILCKSVNVFITYYTADLVFYVNQFTTFIVNGTMYLCSNKDI